MTKRPKSVIILGLMLEGYPVTFGDREYCMCEGRFGVKGTRLNTITHQTDEVFLGVEITLDTFIHMCDKLTDEDVAILVGNKVLTDINRKDR